MRRARCTWRGDLVMSYSEPTRLVQVTLVHPDGTETVTRGQIGWAIERGEVRWRVDGELIPPVTTAKDPVYAVGTSCDTYQGCARRLGHRGEHGYPLPSRIWYRLRRVVGRA